MDFGDCGDVHLHRCLSNDVFALVFSFQILSFAVGPQYGVNFPLTENKAITHSQSMHLTQYIASVCILKLLQVYFSSHAVYLCNYVALLSDLFSKLPLI